MNNCFTVKVFILCMFLGAIFDGSSSSGRKGPSPPRNLRRSVVGPPGERKHHVYWTASQETWGLAVNYSVELCINDSIDADNNSCKWSRNSLCQPRNILSAIKEFSCVLEKKDFFSNTGEFCNYTICVVASNEVETARSCIFAPWVVIGLATPLPPTQFSVLPKNTGGVRVQWGLGFYSLYDTVVIVKYHAEHKPNKTKEVRKRNKLTLTKLEAYTKYCFYVVLQTVSRYGKLSAPSDALGPKCVRTLAGDPTDPPVVRRADSVPFPDDKSLRNVTVEWTPAKESSWKGTPGQYVLYTNFPDRKSTYNISHTSNRTVLQKLNSADSYSVYLRSCNEEGKCSVIGNRYVIKPLQDNSFQASKQEGFTSAPIAPIVVAVIVCLVGAGIVLYIFFNFRKNRRDNASQPPLSDLVQLDDLADPHEYNVAEQSEHTYSALHAYVSNDAKDEDRV